MRDLVQKLPSGNPQHDQGTSDDTIAAVLATLNEVIKKNAEFSRYVQYHSKLLYIFCSYQIEAFNKLLVIRSNPIKPSIYYTLIKKKILLIETDLLNHST